MITNSESRKPRQTSQANSQSGITLIQCLAYMAVLGVLISVGGMTVGKAWTQSRALSRNSQDIQRALSAGERWRADVRKATRPAETTGSPERQSLRITTVEGFVEYEFAGGELRRRAGGENAPWVTLLPAVKNSQMQKDTRDDVTGWRWELELQTTNKLARVRPLFTFMAVPLKEDAR